MISSESSQKWRLTRKQERPYWYDGEVCGDCEGVKGKLPNEQSPVENNKPPSPIPGPCGKALQRRAEWQTTDAAQWCRVCASSCTAKEGKRAALAQGGNTCWLSAILQLFFHSGSFAVWEQARTCCCRSVGCFSCHMALTFRETTEPGAKRSLQDWQSIATAIFMARGQQQDAAEFFNLLTAKWAERKNSRCRKDGALFAEPYLLEMFHERKKLHACECKQPGASVSTRVERMLGMMLPLSKSSCPTSVQKLIHEQFADEAEESTSQGDRCASCGGQPTVIHRSHFKDVSQLQTLYIHLKRVDAEGRKSRREVLVNTYVILPGKAFRLVGIATHLGEDANGHYITWIRARHEYNIYDDGKHISLEIRCFHSWSSIQLLPLYTSQRISL